jgi:hypothetical protein
MVASLSVGTGAYLHQYPTVRRERLRGGGGTSALFRCKFAPS